MNDEILLNNSRICFSFESFNKILRIPPVGHYRQSNPRAGNKRPTIGNILDFLDLHSALKPLTCPWQAKGKSFP